MAPARIDFIAGRNVPVQVRHTHPNNFIVQQIGVERRINRLCRMLEILRKGTILHSFPGLWATW